MFLKLRFSSKCENKRTNMKELIFELVIDDTIAGGTGVKYWM